MVTFIIRCVWFCNVIHVTKFGGSGGNFVTSLTVSHTGFTEHIIIKGECGDCRFPVFWGYVWGVILDQKWGVK